MLNLVTCLESDDEPASHTDKRLANRLLKHWEGLRHNKSFPLITDLNLDEIGELVPYAFKLDLSSGMDSPMFRFVGRALVCDCGGDVTNQDPSALLPQSLLARAVKHRGEVVAKSKPVIVAEEFVNSEGNQVLYRAVMLPFSSNGSEVDYIIGAINSKTIRADASESAAAGNELENTIERERTPLQASVNRRFVNPNRKQVSITPRKRRRIKVRRKLLQKDSASDGSMANSRISLRPCELSATAATTRAIPGQSAHIIVLGSEKGGTGKSTTAMHVLVSLLYEGKKVGSIDLDSPQFSLTRYIANRQALNRRQKLDLPLPNHTVQSDRGNGSSLFENELARLSDSCDFIVVDTPGSDSAISRMAHARADTLITPINDSFIDLDTLAVLEADTREIVRRGHYAELVAYARKQKEAQAGHDFEWIIVRNRLSNLDARNKQQMADTLEKLSGYLGFRNGAGLSERVIYRELFLKGLTLLDLHQQSAGVSLSMSHVAARQELRTLLETIKSAQHGSDRTASG